MKKQEIPVEDFYYIEDFECISSNLSDYLLIINTEIDILEAANGKKYWKEILYRPGKKSTINKINRINNQSADFIKQKDVLILILKNFKGVINDKVNNTKLGEAISLLTYSIFSSEQIRQKLPKQEDKKEIYIEAIKKLKDTVIQLENDLSRIKK